MSPFKFAMRSKVRDGITGMVYVIIGRMEYTSYTQYYLQATAVGYDSGKPHEPIWLDEDRLEVATEHDPDEQSPG